MAETPRLPTVAAAATRASTGSNVPAAASAVASASAAGAVPREGEQGPRKRGRHVHERQVLADFFSEQDQAHGSTPPTDLIKKMSTRDLYEDVYKTYKVDASFSNLPKATQGRMLAEISAVAPRVASRVVQVSDADPSAITVARTHTHEAIVVPPAALEAAGADRTASVKEMHLAQLCELHAYDVLEDFARSLEFGGVPRRTTLHKLVRIDLRACMPHSMYRASADTAYLLLELDERQVFFAAVEVRWCATDEAVAEPYETLTAAMLGELGPLLVDVGSHFYFCCPCI